MDRVTVNIRDYRDSFKEYFNRKDEVSIEELLNVVEDLIFENEDLKEEISDLKNSNYNETSEYIKEDDIC